MTPQKAIIERIRREKFRIGISIDEDTKAGYEAIKGDLNRALIQLSEDLYTKQIHFLLELIQNADDNKYNGIEPASLKFYVDAEKILVQNNEKGFSEPNVKALCAV